MAKFKVLRERATIAMATGAPMPEWTSHQVGDVTVHRRVRPVTEADFIELTDPRTTEDRNAQAAEALRQLPEPLREWRRFIVATAERSGDRLVSRPNRAWLSKAESLQIQRMAAEAEDPLVWLSAEDPHSLGQLMSKADRRKQDQELFSLARSVSQAVDLVMPKAQDPNGVFAPVSVDASFLDRLEALAAEIERKCGKPPAAAGESAAGQQPAKSPGIGARAAPDPETAAQYRKIIENLIQYAPNHVSMAKHYRAATGTADAFHSSAPGRLFEGLKIHARLRLRTTGEKRAQQVHIESTPEEVEEVLQIPWLGFDPQERARLLKVFRERRVVEHT